MSNTSFSCHIVQHLYLLLPPQSVPDIWTGGTILGGSPYFCDIAITTFKECAIYSEVSDELSVCNSSHHTPACVTSELSIDLDKE